MKAIYKYKLESEACSIFLPKGAEILCAQAQNEIPCIWVLLNPNILFDELRRFCILVTGPGYDVQEKLRYINTLQLQGGKIVLHIFEALN